MSQILLYNAKIEEDFLEAGKFYQSGPEFFIFNIKIKKTFYDKINSITISYFNVNSFKDQFNAHNDISTDNFKYFNTNISQSSSELLNFHSNNYGNNFIYGYNQSENKIIKNITFDKENVYHIKKNDYKIFIPFLASREIISLEDSANESLRFRVFAKDEKNNIIWDSDILYLNRRLSSIINDINNEINLDYLSYYVQDSLESASLYHLNDSAIRLKFNRPLSFFNESEIRDVVDDLNPAQSFKVNYTLKYNNKIISRVNNSSEAISTENIIIDDMDEEFEFKHLLFEDNYVDILNDFYLGKENFDFTLSISLTNSNSTRDIPSYTITFNRNSSFITKINEDYNEAFKEYLVRSINPIIRFQNINRFETRHEFSLLEIEGIDFEKLSINQIYHENLLGNNNSTTNIYTKDNSSTSTFYNLSEIQNINELSNISDSTSENEINFFTFTRTSSQYGSSLIRYELKYELGDLIVFKVITGQEIIQNISSIIENNFDNKLLSTNKIFNQNTDIVFNYDTSSDSGQTVSIERFIINDINAFSSLCLLFNYSNPHEFLRNSLIKLNYGVISNIAGTETSYHTEIYFDMSEVFDLVDDSNLSLSSRDFNFDISVMERESSSGLSLQQIALNLRSDQELTYEYFIEADIIPIHQVIFKYRNKGIDENFNVLDSFNSATEAETSDSEFHKMFYESDLSLAYAKFLKAKNSYYNGSVNNVIFRNIVKEVILNPIKITNPGSFFKRTLILTKEAIIEDLGFDDINIPDRGDDDFESNFFDNDRGGL